MKWLVTTFLVLLLAFLSHWDTSLNPKVISREILSPEVNCKWSDAQILDSKIELKEEPRCVLHWEEHSFSTIEWTCQCEQPADWSFASVVAGDIEEYAVKVSQSSIRPVAIKPYVRIEGTTVRLSWQLLESAHFAVITLPSRIVIHSASARLFSFTSSTNQYEWWTVLRWIVVLGCTATLLWMWLKLLLDWICARSKYLLLVAWSVQGIAFIFLVPPFQAPDENRHWKQSLFWFRSADELALIELPVRIGSESIRFNSGFPFRWQLMNREAGSPELFEGEGKGASYAGPWAYPFVGLVSLVFPKVESTKQALLFYQLAKLVPYGCCLGLLALGIRRFQLSHLALVLLGFPLFQQQTLAISPDSFLILGSISLYYLLRAWQKERSWKRFCVLMLLALCLIASKPPIYSLFLLVPFFAIPPRRWPIKRMLVGLVLLILCGILAGMYGFRLIQDDAQTSNTLWGQLRFLSSAEGWNSLLSGLLQLGGLPFSFRSWAQPLGWIDFYFTGNHLQCIAVSLILAMILDVSPREDKDIHISHVSGKWSLHFWLLLLGMMIFIWLTLGLLWFLTISPIGKSEIYGMQFRYYFPVIALGCCHLGTPRWICQINSIYEPCFRSRWLISLLMVGMAFLMFLRGHYLISEMMTRYSP